MDTHKHLSRVPIFVNFDNDEVETFTKSDFTWKDIEDEFGETERIAAKGTYLFRYLSIEPALSTLVSRHLWAVNPATWKDAYEKDVYECITTYISSLKNRIFCICFSTKDVCEPAWKMYSDGDPSLRLELGTKELYDNITTALNHSSIIKQIIIGKVKYCSTREITKFINQFPSSIFSSIDPNLTSAESAAVDLLLHKRKAFDYEQEVRIIFILNDNVDCNSISNNQHLEIPLTQHFPKILKEIQLSPDIPPVTAYYLRDTMIGILKPQTNTSIKFNQSRLYGNSLTNAKTTVKVLTQQQINNQFILK